MSLLDNLLKAIAEEGTSLKQALGTDVGHLFEPKPWKTYDQELPPPAAFTASQKLIANCNELVALLTPTKVKLLTECVANNSTIGLGIAAEFEIAQKIIDNGGEASVAHLAKVCNTDEHKLACTMHMLANRHIFVEVAPDIFRNNRHSYELRNETGAAAMMTIETDEGYRSGLGWLPTMKDPKTMHDLDPGNGAFSKAFGVNMGVGPWLGTPEGANLMKKFGAGIPWLGNITVVATRTDIPWDAYGKTVCDVGAGPGAVMLEVKKKYPHLKVICQELEAMLPVIKGTFAELPEALEDGSVEIQVHDYFTPQTTDADVYWLRGVIRDYQDEVSQKILEHLRGALERNPKARILVNELIIPSLITPASAPDQPAADNLPPSQSAYPDTCHMMQLSTMILMGGKERTFADLVKIGEAAGLKVVKFHQLRMFTGTIEFGLA